MNVYVQRTSSCIGGPGTNAGDSELDEAFVLSSKTFKFQMCQTGLNVILRQVNRFSESRKRRRFEQGAKLPSLYH